MKINRSFFLTIKNYESLVSSSVVAIIVIFLFFIFVIPNLEKAKEIATSEKELSQKLATLKSKESVLSKMDLEGLREDFLKLSKVIPDNKDFVSLFDTFDALEKKTGVSITKTNFQLGNVSTGSAKLAKNASIVGTSIPLNFAITGNINALSKFLDELSLLKGRLITISKIDMKYRDNNEIELQMTGLAYFHPYPATIGNIYTPISSINKKQQDLLSKIRSMEISDISESDYTQIPSGKKDLFR